MDDYFWSHTKTLDGGKSLAFVHIDTNFLAYGPHGEGGRKYMKRYFSSLQWTDDFLLDHVDWLLKENQNATYKIAVGHHPVGHISGGWRQLPEVEPLLQKYGF